MKKSIYEKLAIAFIILGVIFIALSLLLFSYKQVFDTNMGINDNIFGNFGSLLAGTVGILWALAGVFLFFAALNAQRNDFNEQIMEIRSQNRSLLLQNFENNFYNLLKLKFDLLNRQHRIEINTPILGLVIIRNFGTQLTNDFSTKTNVNIQSVIDDFRDFYSEKYKVDPDYSYLRSYFSHIFLIISLIDSNKYLTDSEKTAYADIFRSQISQEELIIIFYWPL